MPDAMVTPLGAPRAASPGKYRKDSIHTPFPVSSSSSPSSSSLSGSGSGATFVAYHPEKGIVVDPSAVLQPFQSGLKTIFKFLNRRSARRSPLLIILLFLLLSLFGMLKFRPDFLPPSYAEEWSFEAHLPQVNPRLSPGDLESGTLARFVAFAPIKETGFNYQLQSLIIQHHVAFSANRSLAYEPYHVVDSILPISFFTWPFISSRIPMSALLYSISNGFEKLYNRRRAVPLRQYTRLCSKSKAARHLDLSPETELSDSQAKHVGMVALDRMVKTLEEEDTKCVEVDVNPFHRE